MTLFADDGDGTYGRLVFENEKHRFWENDFTRNFLKRLIEYDHNGIAPNGRFFVYLAEDKSDGSRTYVAFDGKGMPFMDWNSPELFDLKLMCFREDLKEEYDIVNMAKKRKA